MSSLPSSLSIPIVYYQFLFQYDFQFFENNYIMNKSKLKCEGTSVYAQKYLLYVPKGINMHLHKCDNIEKKQTFKMQ